MKTPLTIHKVTPIYVVDRIEPALAFWEGLGWEKVVEVPHEDRLGFVILTHGEREIMLQTRDSVRADLGADLDPTCAVYMDVPSLADARAALDGKRRKPSGAAAGGAEHRVLIESRETFYGAREMWVIDPAGVLVGFAEIQKKS